MHRHLEALLGDVRVVKVCHGHIKNLAWVRSNFGIAVISPVFDTAEHAQAVHGLSPSLEAPTGHYFDWQLTNTHQNASWRQRPMPAEMLQYAAMEAGALLPLQVALEVATNKVAMDFRLQDAELETASDNELESVC